MDTTTERSSGTFGIVHTGITARSDNDPQLSLSFFVVVVLLLRYCDPLPAMMATAICPLTKSSMTSLIAVANKTIASGTAVVYREVGETPSIC